MLSHCRSVIHSEITEWEPAYLVIRGSFIGADFPPERFIRTPVRTLRALLIDIDYREKFAANVASGTTALLAEHLYVFMQLKLDPRKKPKKAPADSFLPYPKLKPPEDDTPKGLRPRTKQFLNELFKEQRIPIHVYMTLCNPPKEPS